MKFSGKIAALAALVVLASLAQFCQKAESPASAQPKDSSSGEAAPPAPPRAKADTFTAKAADKNTEPEAEAEQAREAPANPFQTLAAAAGRMDSLKKFVRTADLKFRVADAVRSTLEIEKIAAKNGGYVTQSDLNSQQQSRKVTALTRDSSVETLKIEPECRLVLRIPFQQLDTALREIGRQSELFDFRKVSAEDIGLKLLENELIALRQKLYGEQVSAIAEDQDVKSESRLNAAERNLQSRAASDQARLDLLKIEDQIRYSTVSIHLYQLPVVRQQVIANIQNQVAEVPFGQRLAAAFASGWAMLEMVFIGILSIWPLILVGLGVWLFVFKPRRKVATV